MITRKRGRSLANPVINITTDTSTSPQSDTQKFSDQSEENVVTSPESDTNDWGLEELFGPDFNLNLDCDLIDSLSFGGTQANPTKDETNGSLVLDVPTSCVRGVTPRSRLQDVSSQLVNKNAMAARINRLKKKEYIRGLEQNIDALVSENRVLKQENGNLTSKVEELESETRYLRAVLANESMLAQLLSRLSGVNGMKFSTSLFQESQKNDHDYAMPRKRVKVEDADAAGGICLHVDKDHVSVEFCTKCAESSSLSLKM